MRALEEKTGVKNPRLQSRPILRADCKAYRDGYFALTNARQFNQTGLQPISVSEVLAYVEISGIDKGYPAEKFLRIMQAMDAVHLDWWSRKQASNNKK